MAESSSVKLTYDDYLLLPHDGKRHELIDGDHHVTPSPNTAHQRVSINLSRILGAHVRAHGLGRVFAAPLDVVLSDVDVVEPDLLFVSAKRLEIVTDKNVRGAPDLVVEILSESTRRTDEVVKRELYERHGVQEYWIVDPGVETVRVYRREANAFVRADLSKESGADISSLLLPGLVVPVAEIFE